MPDLPVIDLLTRRPDLDTATVGDALDMWARWGA